MMRRSMLGMVAFASMFLVACGPRDNPADNDHTDKAQADTRTGVPDNKDFTPWMSHAELDDFLKQFDTNPPGGHPNYWDNGHWINAVEGRWYEGIPQYRISYGETPHDHHCAWYWYLNQDQQSFSNHVHEFADQGFVLLDPNSFQRPDDTPRYQGVWHLVGAKKSDTPAVADQGTNSTVNPAAPSPQVVATPNQPTTQSTPASDLNAKLKAELDRATQAVLTLKDPKDFDTIISEMAGAVNDTRTSAYGNSADRQSAYTQLQEVNRYLKQWQSYLIDTNAGNTQATANDLRNLSETNSSFMPIPRSELLERAGKAAAQPPQAMEAKIVLNSLDDLPAAISQLTALQRGGNYSMEMNGLMNAMQNLQTANLAYQAKNYTGALQQLANNPMFAMASAGMAVSGPATTEPESNGESVHKKLADLKNSLFILVVQALLAMPDAPAPQKDETAPDYLLRLAAVKAAAADWPGLQQVLQVYQQAAASFNSPAWLQEDLVGLHAFAVANKLEGAGQHLDAIRSYRQALATVGKFFPAGPPSKQLDELQKKYPDLYQKALQTPITPGTP